MVGALAVGALAGCGSSALSCTQMENGAPKQCVEYSDFSTFSSVNSMASIQVLCRGFGVEPKSELCNTTGAAAGCREVKEGAWTQVTWTYTSATVKTEADVSCQSRMTKLRPDRTDAPK